MVDYSITIFRMSDISLHRNIVSITIIIIYLLFTITISIAIS